MVFSVLPASVKNSVIFSGLSVQERDALIKDGRIRQLAQGQMLFAQGDPVTHFYLIISGTIQLFRANVEGGQKTIEVAVTGQSLCEDEIMDACQRHRANCVAVQDSAVVEFSANWLKEAARMNGAFALNLLSLIASRAHRAELEAEHQATMSAAQLVACFLQRICVLYDMDPKGFDLPYSKTLIASRLGMELETFSRTLGKLKEHGISVEGSRVAIHDLARVGEYVCNFCSVAGECPTHQAMGKKMPGVCGNTA